LIIKGGIEGKVYVDSSKELTRLIGDLFIFCNAKIQPTAEIYRGSIKAAPRGQLELFLLG